MSDPSTSISNAYQVFMADAPRHAQAWGGMVQALASASALDGKTAALAYLAVLAALRLESGVPFHVQQAEQIRLYREAWKEAGHTRPPRVSVSRSISSSQVSTWPGASMARKRPPWRPSISPQ
mgnify:CR=1 FL=1